MNEDLLHIATIIVHIVSVCGFITNLIAIITIIKSQKMHTSHLIENWRFGILCGYLAINNIAVLLLNSTWLAFFCLGVFAKGSFASRAVGMTGLALFIAGIRFHILISVNRLMSIVFP
ncbi:hypothetical protein PMAYCL1PPCAC_10963, partial [Pristionchus mayeri]